MMIYRLGQPLCCDKVLCHFGINLHTDSLTSRYYTRIYMKWFSDLTVCDSRHQCSKIKVGTPYKSGPLRTILCLMSQIGDIINTITNYNLFRTLKKTMMHNIFPVSLLDITFNNSMYNVLQFLCTVNLPGSIYLRLSR